MSGLPSLGLSQYGWIFAKTQNSGIVVRSMAAISEWPPIANFQSDPRHLAHEELHSLRRVWENQEQDLIAQGALGEFQRRLRREWAIETGILENIYTLDRRVTQTLIEKGIDAALIPRGANGADHLRVARTIQDHYDALEGIFSFVHEQRGLSASYIRTLHAELLRNQDTYTAVDPANRVFEERLEKGQYRTSPYRARRPDGSVVEYCPPENIASEMDSLIRMHRDHGQSTPPAVEAAWLHHRFSQIRPFVDGNGRVARALASLVLIERGWFPLIVKREDYTRYVRGLAVADGGDLRPLISLFGETQRNVLIQASEVVYDVASAGSTDEAIIAVRDRLLLLHRLPNKEWLTAKETARQLTTATLRSVAQIVQQLSLGIANVRRGFSFGSRSAPQNGFDEVRAKAVQNAGQTPDFSEFNSVVQLLLNTDRHCVLTISFHGIGPRYRGLIGVVAYLEAPGSDPILLEGGTFLINYQEDLVSAQARFSAWLGRMMVCGLNEWRRVL